MLKHLTSPWAIGLICGPLATMAPVLAQTSAPSMPACKAGNSATCPGEGKTAMKSISVDDLMKLRVSGVPSFLLDVREPNEVAEGTIAGSVNIPMNQVQARIGELPKDREIVVMCRSGHRSARVTAMLNALGYTNAVNLTGGMTAWSQRFAP